MITYEFKRQFKRKANIIFFIFAFLSLIFVQFVYEYLIGPIGIFSDSEFMELLIKGYAPIVSLQNMDNTKLILEFSERFSQCTDAAAQLAREFMDALGVTFYFGSFLIGSFALTKEQLNKDQELLGVNVIKSTEFVVGKYIACLTYSLLIMAAMILLPFISSFRLKQIGYTGSPTAYWKYFILWIIPAVTVILIFQMFMSIYLKEKEAGIIIHLVLSILMVSPVNNYPLYKTVVRFNGVDENFYKGVINEITFNRLFISMISVILIFVTIHRFKLQQKSS